MTPQENLLDKYYKGETSLEEERELKKTILESDENVAEQDIFNFYENEIDIPDDIEDVVFDGLELEQNKRIGVRRKLYQVISAAAVVLIVLSVYLDFRHKKQTRIEDNFFVLEQALYQVSESLQPQQEPGEMLVFWVDDDVEIIIN